MTPQDAVLALVAIGWSESRISREVGTSQPTIHRIKRGAMPRGPSFAVSQSVIDLAERVAKEANADLEASNSARVGIGKTAEQAAASPATPLGEAA